MKKKLTTMNSKQVLEHLTNGATLRTRWSYGQRQNILKLTTGETFYIQRSNIDALLKTRCLYSIPFSGDNYEYRLVSGE